MKLETVLLEVQSRAYGVDWRGAMTWLRDNAPKTIKRMVENPDFDYVYRGYYSGGESYNVISPNTKRRKSRNSKNHYNLWMSEHSSWLSYPPRNRSIICTTDNNYARNGWTDIALVVPKDGARWGVCSSHDLWWSFSRGISEVTGKGHGNLKEFFSVLEYLVSLITKKSNDGMDYDSYPEMISDLKEKQKILQEKPELLSYLPSRPDIHLIVEWLSKNDFDFIKIFEVVFEPKKNGFRRSTDYMDVSEEHNREVWTDSDCLLVNIGNEDAKVDFLSDVEREIAHW